MDVNQICVCAVRANLIKEKSLSLEWTCKNRLVQTDAIVPFFAKYSIVQHATRVYFIHFVDSNRDFDIMTVCEAIVVEVFLQ